MKIHRTERQLVVLCGHASVMTRLDIANAVREVAKYSNNPKVTHCCAVKCILAYLNTCPTIMFAGGAISWMSKVQRVVALSSTESEYIALSSVAQELLFF
ncbi:unnamed protein product [Choristocarpus tenellus]